MIRLRGVCRAYDLAAGARPVLDGVSLDVDGGEMVALAGRSGSGKTTLLNIVGGLDTGYQGSVVVAGQELGALADTALSAFRNRMVGFVFQAFHLLEHVSCLDNVTLPAFFARGRRVSDGREVRRRAREVLGWVGLEHRSGARPGQLSGGERQRVALARALFHSPRVLLCDELTGNLDNETAGMVVDILHRACDEEGCTVVVVTHDEAVMRSSGRVLRLESGRLLDLDRHRLDRSVTG